MRNDSVGNRISREMLYTDAVDRFIENVVSCQLFRIGDMYIHRARKHVINCRRL